MAGEHLDIIRINNKNRKNERFHSLRVILSYYLSHRIALFTGIMDVKLWGGFEHVIWGGYVEILPKCPNPL